MFINDKYHSIQVNLKTEYANKSNLKLQCYINNSTSPHSPTYSATSTSDGVSFTIPFSDFNINDEITKIRVYTNTTTDIWNTREGVNILINGDDALVKGVENDSILDIGESPCRHEKFALNFDKIGDYSLQGFYVGNDFVEYATTDEYHFKVSPQSISETPSTDVYKLEFENPNISKLTWNDKTPIVFILTKNGQPVSGETVECLIGNNIWSADTTPQGKVWQRLGESVTAGTYKFGAYYVDGSTILAKTDYKTVVVEKANANITYTNGNLHKNDTMSVWVKDQYGSPIVNEKVSIYINGRLWNFKTDSTGKFSFKVTYKRTYNFKVVYNGNANIKAKTVSFSKVVS